MASGGGGGLGTGSPAWNIASSLKLRSAAMGLNATSTLGLQLSNLSLNLGTTSGFTTHDQQHPHHQLRGAGQLNGATVEGFGNNENLAPGSIARTGSPGLLAGMTLVGVTSHEAKMKSIQ